MFQTMWMLGRGSLLSYRPSFQVYRKFVGLKLTKAHKVQREFMTKSPQWGLNVGKSDESSSK